MPPGCRRGKRPASATSRAGATEGSRRAMPATEAGSIPSPPGPAGASIGAVMAPAAGVSPPRSLRRAAPWARPAASAAANPAAAAWRLGAPPGAAAPFPAAATRCDSSPVEPPDDRAAAAPERFAVNRSPGNPPAVATSPGSLEDAARARGPAGWREMPRAPAPGEIAGDSAPPASAMAARRTVLPAAPPSAASAVSLGAVPMSPATVAPSAPARRVEVPGRSTSVAASRPAACPAWAAVPVPAAVPFPGRAAMVTCGTGRRGLRPGTPPRPSPRRLSEARMVGSIVGRPPPAAAARPGSAT